MTSEERKQIRYQRRKAAREQKKKEKYGDCDNYDKVFSFDNLYSSFAKCRKNVRWKYSTQTYNINRLKYTWLAYKELHGIDGKSYKFGGHNTFTLMERGKRRKIAAVKLPDRVIQKCYCDYSLTPMLTRGLIRDNSASRIGMGTHYTRKRIIRDILRAYRRNGRDFYIIITDAKNYFDSLQHEVIADKIRKEYTDQRLIDFAIYCLDQEGADGKGLGLGSQPNQAYAISYLNPVDHIVSSIAKYKRYMDDSIAIADTLQEAHAVVEAQGRECNKLGIELHDNKTIIAPATHTFTILKTRYQIKADGTIIKKPWGDGIKRTKRKLKMFPRLIERGVITKEYADNFYKSIMGNFKGYNAYKISESITELYNEIYRKEQT